MTRRRFLPTPTAILRPNEGNVRLYRQAILDGRMTEEEVTAILGKSPWESQGKIPAGRWTSSAAASLVSPSVSLDDGWAPPTLDGSGRSSRGFLASYDPATRSWRTSQVSLLPTEAGQCQRFSETWPPSGTMRNGQAYRQPPLVPRISVTESSLWHTPQEHNGTQGPKSPENFWQTMKDHGSQITLTDQVRMWPTPQAMDAYSIPDGNREERLKKGGCRNLGQEIGGQLNPTWVEWLMGFPLGWTVLEPSATPSSRKSRSGSGSKSSRRSR